MDVKIYRDKALAPDKYVGRIDARGKVLEVELGEDDYLGWIDYNEGDIYDSLDAIIGWVEKDGEVIRLVEDQEEEIGFVTDDGELYWYSRNEEEYFGKLKDMQDFSEGAAALLFFLEKKQ
jgi:hypothetical protein